MIQLSTLPVPALVQGATPAGFPFTTTSDFALALADLAGATAPPIPVTTLPPDGLALGLPRQDIAATGKTVPEGHVDAPALPIPSATMPIAAIEAEVAAAVAPAVPEGDAETVSVPAAETPPPVAMPKGKLARRTPPPETPVVAAPAPIIASDTAEADDTVRAVAAGPSPATAPAPIVAGDAATPPPVLAVAPQPSAATPAGPAPSSDPPEIPAPSRRTRAADIHPAATSPAAPTVTPMPVGDAAVPSVGAQTTIDGPPAAPVAATPAARFVPHPQAAPSLTTEADVSTVEPVAEASARTPAPATDGAPRRVGTALAPDVPAKRPAGDSLANVADPQPTGEASPAAARVTPASASPATPAPPVAPVASAAQPAIARATARSDPSAIRTASGRSAPINPHAIPVRAAGTTGSAAPAAQPAATSTVAAPQPDTAPSIPAVAAGIARAVENTPAAAPFARPAVSSAASAPALTTVPASVAPQGVTPAPIATARIAAAPPTAAPIAVPASPVEASPFVASPSASARPAAAGEAARATSPVTVTVVALPTAPPPPPILQPAGQAFAAAMFAASEAPRAPEEREAAPALSPLSAAPSAHGATTPVTAPASGQQATLDMTKGDWMASMIDHIEALRDESGAVRETRMKLAPDALGKVEVSVHRDESGTLQVRIAADTPQARALLADAAPRLAEMAEQRGLKLGGANVDAGTAFADSNRREAQGQPAPLRHRPASAAAADAGTDTTTDSRIA